MNKILKEDLEMIVNADLPFEKFKNKTVLITGASGMIGSYLARSFLKLNERNYNITLIALVRNLDKLGEDIKADKHTIVLEQDVCDDINIDQNVDVVIHAASPASPVIMKEHPVDTIKANVLGTYNTLEVARKNDGCQYLYVSSREVYGQPYENQEYFKENDYGFVDPLNVRSCYPEGKKAAENFCVCYKEQYDVNTMIVRPAHIYGPGMSLNDGRVQADFLRDVMNDRDILLKSDGSAIRTYTYIADAILAMFYVLLKGDELVYNIGDESSKVTIKELAETMIKASGKDLKLTFEIKDTKGCAPFTLGILNTGKLRALGFKTKYSVYEGLKRLIRYFELEGE